VIIISLQYKEKDYQGLFKLRPRLSSQSSQPKPLCCTRDTEDNIVSKVSIDKIGNSAARKSMEVGGK
jgi:hypothetical protein